MSSSEKVENENETINITQKELKEFPVYKVVVFSDRAELHRLVKLDNLPLGKNEIKLLGLPTTSDSNSVRVEGQGEAEILDVSFPERFIDEVKESNQVEDWRNELKESEIQMKKMNASLENVVKLKQVLDSYATNLTSNNKLNLLDPSNIKSMEEFLSIYSSKSLEYDTDIQKKRLDIEKLKSEIDLLNSKISSHKPSTLKKKITDVSVKINVLLEEQSLSLDVSYVVTGASWTPQYDLRVSSEKKTLKIIYYGEIQQLTGEDWENVKISLSTAVPVIGGEPPILPSARLIVSYGYNEQTRYDYSGGEAYYRNARTNDVSKGSGTSATFEISHVATIPSDKTKHRVTICSIELAPTFEYLTHPKLASHAFLKAKAINSSEFAFLPGPASVFLDGNFVCNTNLKSVYPNEDFDCSLGIDSSVKITYKPSKKFQAESGIISKSINEKYSQEIEIKNTKSIPIKITVVDSLPLSTDERIKVNLIEPELKKGSDAKQREDNNIEWVLEMNPSETKTVKIIYTISHASGVSYYEQA